MLNFTNMRIPTKLPAINAIYYFYFQLGWHPWVDTYSIFCTKPVWQLHVPNATDVL